MQFRVYNNLFQNQWRSQYVIQITIMCNINEGRAWLVFTLTQVVLKCVFKSNVSIFCFELESQKFYEWEIWLPNTLPNINIMFHILRKKIFPFLYSVFFSWKSNKLNIIFNWHQNMCRKREVISLILYQQFYCDNLKMLKLLPYI